MWSTTSIQLYIQFHLLQTPHTHCSGIILGMITVQERCTHYLNTTTVTLVQITLTTYAMSKHRSHHDTEPPNAPALEVNRSARCYHFGCTTSINRIASSFTHQPFNDVKNRHVHVHYNITTNNPHTLLQQNIISSGFRLPEIYTVTM